MALAIASLILLSPVLLTVAVAVWMSSGRPALFCQERVGRHGRPFTMLKFRTMRVNSGRVHITAEDDVRVTRVGRVLRRTKLDELPELWNIVRGDMSLVGARPEVPQYVDLADPLWAEVLRWRPGITDPVTLALRNEERLIARVSGDRDVFYRTVLQPWKLNGYVAYLRRRTPWSDTIVLLRSLFAVAGLGPHPPSMPCEPGTSPWSRPKSPSEDLRPAS